jgi:hypothetical protein
VTLGAVTLGFVTHGSVTLLGRPLRSLAVVLRVKGVGGRGPAGTQTDVGVVVVRVVAVPEGGTGVVETKT